MPGSTPAAFSRPPLRERLRLADALRTETVGGMLLLAAAVAALIWANTGSGSYAAVRDFHFGRPPSASTCRSGTGPPTACSPSSSSSPASS